MSDALAGALEQQKRLIERLVRERDEARAVVERLREIEEACRMFYDQQIGALPCARSRPHSPASTGRRTDMARIYLRAKVEIHIDVPDEDVAEWEYGEDEDCPDWIRECMDDAATIIPQSEVIAIGWPGEEWVRVYAEVIDKVEVRCES